MDKNQNPIPQFQDKCRKELFGRFASSKSGNDD
jgi:hypothetical protein